MPYNILNNMSAEDAWNNTSPVVQQPVVQEQPIQQEQVPQMSNYQQAMNNLPNAEYLGGDYNRARWMQEDMDSRGVTNPLISMLRYDTKIAPLVQAAREDEIRESFGLASNPNTDPQTKTEALAKLAYYMKSPDLVNETNLKRMKTLHDMGLMENQNYDVGNSVLSSLGDFTEGEQWMSPDGTGDSRTQCSNFVSDVLRRSGIKGLYSANGDELMKQFGSAYHQGLDGIKPGDVLNFKDHVGFYVGNGQYVARNSSGGVHQGTMDEAVAAFGQPLGYGSVSEFTGANRKYIKDPNYVSPKDKFNRHIYESDRDHALKVANYNRMVDRDNMKYSGVGGVNQQALNKANISMRNSALNMAQLQDINPEEEKDKKQYETNMNKFANDIGSLCQMYDDGTKDSLSFGLAMYNELNKTPSGLRPEVLTEGIARAVYARRGDVDPFKLQEAMLNYIYNGGRQQQDGNDSVADFRRYDNEHPFSYRALDVADNRRNSWDNAFR